MEPIETTNQRVTLYNMPQGASERYAQDAKLRDRVEELGWTTRSGLVEASVERLVTTSSDGPARTHINCLLEADQRVSKAMHSKRPCKLRLQTVGKRPLGSLAHHEALLAKLRQLDIGDERLVRALEIATRDLKERQFVQGNMGQTAA